MKRRVLFPFEFRAGESAKAGVLRLIGLLRRHATLRTAPPPARRPQAVHETRILLKRVRALIRLIQPGLDPQGVRRLASAETEIRKVARSLARARDGTVGLATLTRLIEQAPSRDRDKLAPLRAWFEGRFQARPLHGDTVAKALRAAPEAMSRTADALKSLDWPNHGWRLLETGWHEGYRRARRRMRRAEERGKPVFFHDARTAVKRLMYQIQWLARLSPAHAVRLADALDELQDSLGEDHDLAVLDGLLSKAPARLRSGGASRRLRAAMARRQLKLRRRALKVARTALKERPSAFVADLHRDRHRRRPSP